MVRAGREAHPGLGPTINQSDGEVLARRGMGEVEGRAEATQQLGLSVDGMGFARVLLPSDGNHLVEHVEQPLVIARPDPGVGPEPGPKVLSLADVQQDTIRAEHEVDAGAGWDLAEEIGPQAFGQGRGRRRRPVC